MADRTIVIHDPNTNSSITITLVIVTDGAGSLSFGGSGGIDFDYQPANGAPQGTTVFPTDVTGAQVTALRSALSPFFSVARTKMGF